MSFSMTPQRLRDVQAHLEAVSNFYTDESEWDACIAFLVTMSGMNTREAEIAFTDYLEG